MMFSGLLTIGQREKYWRDKLRIQDNVMLVLRSIKVENPQTLGR